MKVTEKIKHLSELKSLAKQVKSRAISGLVLIKAGKRIKEIRTLLGFENGAANTPETAKEYADTVVLNLENKVLLVQRALNDTFKPGKWWMPGGHIEENEIAIEAAKRELKEETGIHARALQFLEKASLPNGGISHRFVCLNEDDSVKLQKDELNDYAWVSVEQLSKYELVGEQNELSALIEQAIKLVKVENAEHLSKTLVLPENPSRNNLSKLVNEYLKKNLQGKIIQTVDGKQVRFNSIKSTKHLSHDGRKSELAAKTIPYIVDVFTQGEFKGREELSKERVDFVAFHTYQKWVEIEQYRLLLEAKAGELPDGSLETLPELLAYSQNIKEKIASDSFQSVGNVINDSIQAGKCTTSDIQYVTPILDSVQPENALLTILAVTDLDGNPISLDDESQEGNAISDLNKALDWPENPMSLEDSEAENLNKVTMTYNQGTATQRQKENNAAGEIVKQVINGELSIDDVTPEQKNILTKYSGNGGGMKDNVTGLRGSQYEYYTPPEIAQGMWDLLKEMGFSGGKVLDPCAGTGVFSSVAPNDVLMDSVELSQTSGTINKILFNDDKHNVTISAFEKVASATDDEQYDAVITNVPFGENKDRGGNQYHDIRYQECDLDTYFILRSLDKLKPNGLAVFMGSKRFVSSKKHHKFRQLASLKAEFMGAYRMPTSLFSSAGADVETDVMVFKKHSRANLERIDELSQSNPKSLKDANVLWDSFISGRYFQNEGKRYILGEERVTKDKWGKEVMQVVNDDSIANIAKLLRRFGGSRIDWELLELTEGANIQYKNGDIVYFAGVPREYQNGAFIAVKGEALPYQPQNTEKLNAYTDVIQVIEDKLSMKEFVELSSHVKSTQAAFPSEIADICRISLNKETTEEGLKLLFAVRAYAVIRDRQAGRERLNDNLSAYPELSVVGRFIVTKARCPKWFSPEDKELFNVIKKNRVIFDKTTNMYSSVWTGNIEKITDNQALSSAQKYERLLYEQGAKFGLNGGVDKAKFEELFPEIDLVTDNNWCMSLDGSKVISADDYYVGNYAEFKAAHEIAISQEANEEHKARLIRQLNNAQSRIEKTDINQMSFDITSPLISLEHKVQFLNDFYGASGSFYLDKNKKNPIQYKPNYSGDKSHESAVLKRLGYYVTNYSFTTGVSGEDAEIRLPLLKRKIKEVNSQFSSWVKIQKSIAGKLEELINSDEGLRFKQIENGEDLHIDGINSSFHPHDFQRAYVRQQARHMGGICGFDVGLGKTATALMTIQHLQSIGAKNKTIFVVPNNVLTNWRKECKAIYTENVFERCLFVGLVEKKGKFTYSSAQVPADLVSIVENKHSKIYMTYEAFCAIQLATETIADYVSLQLPSLDDLDKAAQLERVKSQAAALEKKIAKDFSSKAEFLERMAVDSLVIDEAHNFKNAVEGSLGARQSVKWLSTATPSNRGINALIKTWYIRNKNSHKDGVLCLTATPITNSPLEIYSMLSIAVGESELKKMTGVNNADDFLKIFCAIDFRPEETITGGEMEQQVFAGLANAKLLRKVIGVSAAIKTTDDVSSVNLQVPEAEEIANNVVLTEQTKEAVEKSKRIYQLARKYNDDTLRKFMTESEMEEVLSAAESGNERLEVLAHPFNFIGKVSNILLDRDVAKNITRYTFSPNHKNAIEMVVDSFNQLGITEERYNTIGVAPSQIVESTLESHGDEMIEKFKVLVNAVIKDNAIEISTKDFKTQARFLALAEKANVRHFLDVEVSSKMAAMLENFNLERSNPQASSGLCKQIIFCDVLGSQQKIKQMLMTKAGVSASKICIVNSIEQDSAEKMQSVQDGFNGEGEENQYEVVIANEKAEFGINLQKGTQAIHHLTVGWTPDGLQQRNGRGVRQGNYLSSVRVYHYDANGTFDSYKRRLVNAKASWIDGLLHGDENFVQVTGGMTRKEAQLLADMVGDEKSFEAKEAELAKMQKDREINAARNDLDMAIQSLKVQKKEFKHLESFQTYIKEKENEVSKLCEIVGDEQKILSALEIDIESAEQRLKSASETEKNTLQKRLEQIVRKRDRKAEVVDKLWQDVILKYARLFPSLVEKGIPLDRYDKRKYDFAKHREEAINLAEKHTLYDDWLEQKSGAEAIMSGSEQLIQKLSNAGQVDSSRVQALLEGKSIVIDNLPALEGDLVVSPKGGVTYSLVNFSGRKDGFYVVEVLGSNNTTPDYIRNSFIIIDDLTRFSLIEKNSLEAEEIYRKLAESDMAVDWSKSIKLVGQYIDPNKERLLPNFEDTILNAEEFDCIIETHKYAELKAQNSPAFKHLERLYSQYGIRYEDDNVYVKSTTEIAKYNQKSSVSLAEFCLRNGYPVSVKMLDSFRPFNVFIGLRVPATIEPSKFDALIKMAEEESVNSTQEEFDDKLRHKLVDVLIDSKLLHEDCRVYAQSILFTGILSKNNISLGLMAAEYASQLFKKRLFEAEKTEKQRQEEERIPMLKEGILGELMFFQGNSYQMNKENPLRDALKEKGLPPSQHIGFLKKGKIWHNGDMAFFSRFKTEELAHLNENSWIVSTKAVEVLEGLLNEYSVRAVPVLRL